VELCESFEGLFDFLKLLSEERQLRNVLLLRFAAQRGEHFAERGVPEQPCGRSSLHFSRFTEFLCNCLP
ncbi:MAG: hypothetical protein ACI8P0_006730, partial [Planctomycetaceae bacterium]